MGIIHRKYTREILQEAVDHATSIAGVLRYLGLNQAGGTHAHISRTIKYFRIDTSHFNRGPQPNGAAKRRYTADQILVRKPIGSRREKPTMLHRALLERGRPYRCALCGNSGVWLDQPLRLEIDHIDGDYHNNEDWNLRFLCANCHSQTDNFAGRSRGKFVNVQGQLALFGTVGPPPSLEA